MVLSPGEANLFFGRQLHKEGLPYTSAGGIGFSLTDPVNWARRTVQVEATVNTVQEGCQAIANAVMKNKTNARRLGCPQGLGRAIQSSAGTCNVDD